MSVTNQKNIFIDTEQYHGSDNKVKLLFPSQTLVVPQGFGMKLSLQQFSMKKSFYNINKNNNTFYVYDPSGSGTYTEFKIAEGDYYTFGNSQADVYSLCKAIYTSLVGTYTDVSVLYNRNTRKLVISSSQLRANNKRIVFLQIPPSRQKFIPNNVTADGIFSDVAEIFGGISNQQDLSGITPTSGLELLSTTGFTSYYPASLYSMETLRILVNLGNTNLETPNMDANSSTSICLTSQTFATIPLQTGTFDGLNLTEPAMVLYEDDGDELFSIKLQQNHIDSATFTLVDGKGRPIDEVNANQYKNGEMNYQMVLRWEVIEAPYVANPSNLPSSNRTGNLLPKLY
jgi:hypothetical protein